MSTIRLGPLGPRLVGPTAVPLGTQPEDQYQDRKLTELFESCSGSYWTRVPLDYKGSGPIGPKDMRPKLGPFGPHSFEPDDQFHKKVRQII